MRNFEVGITVAWTGYVNFRCIFFDLTIYSNNRYDELFNDGTNLEICIRSI